MLRLAQLLKSSNSRSIAAQGAGIFLERRFASPSSHSIDVDEEGLALVRERIFGTRRSGGARTGAKILSKKLVGDKVASYYAAPIAKGDPLFLSLKAEA